MNAGLPTFRNKKTEYTNRVESRNPNAGGQGACVGPLVGSRGPRRRSPLEATGYL